MSHSNIEDEETSFEPIYTSQEDFNPSDTVSSFLSNSAYDPSRLHPLAGLGGGLDYISLDDDDMDGISGTNGGIIPSRGWSDDLLYGTGMAYISGKFSIEKGTGSEIQTKNGNLHCLFSSLY